MHAGLIIDIHTKGMLAPPRNTGRNPSPSCRTCSRCVAPTGWSCARVCYHSGVSVPATKPHARASSAQTQAAIRSKFNNEATVAVPGWPAKAAKIFLEAVDNALTGHDELGLETAGDLLVSAQACRPPGLRPPSSIARLTHTRSTEGSRRAGGGWDYNLAMHIDCPC